MKKKKINDGIRFSKSKARVKRNFSIKENIQNSIEEENEFTIKKDNSFFEIGNNKKKKYFPLLLIFLAFLFAGILASFSSYVKLTFYPKAFSFHFSKNVNISQKEKEGELFFGTVKVSDSFQTIVYADSKKEVPTKARGLVRVLNDYSSEPVRLPPQITFQSTSGKLFLPYNPQNEIIIPGKKGKVPGSLDLELIAKESGGDSNLDFTDFSIPYFKENGMTDRYRNIYAVSKTPFRGGGSEVQWELSSSAKKSLMELAKRDLKEKLMKKIYSLSLVNLLFLSGTEFYSFSSGELSRIEEKRFSYSVHGTLSVFALRKDLLIHFIEQELKKQFSKYDNASFIFKKLSVNVLGKSKEKNKLLLSISVDGYIVPEIQKEKIQKYLLSKKISEGRKLLNEEKSLAAIRISIVPFWKRKFPGKFSHFFIEKGNAYLVKNEEKEEKIKKE